MSTVITKRPYANPDSVGITAVDLPTTDELTIFDACAQWWRADVALSDTAWRDRKGDTPLTMVNGATPVAAVVAAYNGKKAVQFPTGAGSLIATDIFPVVGSGGIVAGGGSYSIVVVGRAGPSPDNAFLLGGGAASSSAQLRVQHLASGEISFTPSGDTPYTNSNIPSYPRVAADGPNIIVASYDDPADVAKIRINRGRFASATATTAAAGASNAQLTVNGTGPLGATGKIDGGEIAEIMIFRLPLLAVANAGVLATVEAYLGTRYGIAAP